MLTFQLWHYGADRGVFCAAVAQASIREEKKLMVENAKLKSDIEQLRNQLLEKERKRGGLFHRSFSLGSNDCSQERRLPLTEAGCAILP